MRRWWLVVALTVLAAPAWAHSVGGRASRGEYSRPDFLPPRAADGIYVDLRHASPQRLYVVRDNQVIRSYPASGDRARRFVPANVHPKGPHEHAGVFYVTGKEPSHWSELYQVTMLWSLRFLNGHFIHGTTPNEYWRLGTAASAGCIRLRRSDARELYNMTPVGTRVEIIGPHGG